MSFVVIFFDGKVRFERVKVFSTVSAISQDSSQAYLEHSSIHGIHGCSICKNPKTKMIVNFLCNKRRKKKEMYERSINIIKHLNEAPL